MIQFVKLSISGSLSGTLIPQKVIITIRKRTFILSLLGVGVGGGGSGG